MTDEVDELVGRLNAKAKYTDRAFDNHSLGETYREAATALQSLAAQLAEKDALLRECEEALSAISRAVGDWDCRIYASDTEMRHARAILDKIKGSQQ